MLLSRLECTSFSLNIERCGSRTRTNEMPCTVYKRRPTDQLTAGFATCNYDALSSVAVRREKSWIN